MKNLLAIVGDYYPYPSSNTNCFDPLLSGLEQDGWHIDVVTVRQWLELSNHEIEANGRNVWRIDDQRSMNTILQNKLSQIPTTSFLKMVNKIFATISKSLFFLRYCLGKPEKRFASWSHQDTINKCIELQKSRHYDVVMSISHPVNCHEIAQGFLKQFSGQKPTWIIYEFDPYCYNEHIYGKNCYKKLAPKQHDLFKSADYICLIPELYDFYQTTPFNTYKDKMLSVNFPNMKPVNYDKKSALDISLNKNRINCIFGGAFGIKIRNPQYSLQTFSQCSGGIQWIILTAFDLTDMLKQIDDKFSVIRVFPMQSRDTSYQAMAQADILVNIGNTVTFQTPGKIFEYMAIGKPIIHFQKIDNDPCLKYLKNYPMVLIINEQENDVVKHAKMIEKFCREYKGKSLTFDEVARFSPALISVNVVNIFVKMINQIISEDKKTISSTEIFFKN